jgi:DNA gyrase/topoisomerase IV subunit B
MTKPSYTHKDIRELGEIEHVQLNCGMYIGETTTPVHLVEEALDNALDEAIAGYAKIIAVNIDTKTGICCIMDDGRGIPIENDVPIKISTKLFTGAKFQDAKSAYRVCAGKNGIGLITILALSDFYTVEIYRDKKHAKFIFENAKLKQKIIEDFKGNVPFSTKIQFKPNKKYFESIIPDIDRIRKRLLVASVEIPSATFVLNIDNKKQEIIKLSKEKFFNQYCLNDTDSSISKIIDLEIRDSEEKFDVKFCYSYEGSISPRVVTSINLLPVDNGGTHVNSFYEIIKEFFPSKAKKLNLKFQPNDVLSGLRIYFSLELEKPDYSSQSKDKLINRKETLSKLLVKLKLELEKYFLKNNEVLTELLTFFDDYRKRLDSKKIKTNGSGKRASTKFTKLRDCTGSHGELYVVEGDSAGGGFIDCRNAKLHAILPLKGKIPSILNQEDILKNKEIGELIQALGCGVGPNFNLSGLRYSKVICGVDPDADGGHIFCLMTIALASLVPDIIKSGHYYLAKIPLYAINRPKSFIPLWTPEELTKARNNNEPILRIKGLGELNPWQLKICCIDEKSRKLIKVKYTKDIKKIMGLFSDVSKKRELLLGV